MRLFCIPYAGGIAASFLSWKKHLDPGIELKSIELSARGRRINEPFYENFKQAVEDIFFQVLDSVNDDYMIFGHSMGSTMAFELAGKICGLGLRPPERIFCSGSVPPNLLNERVSIENMSDEKFKE